MPKFDGLSNIKIVASLGAEVLAADKNGDGVDSRGFETLVHMVNVGAAGVTLSGTDKIELELQHSDTDGSYADVTEASDVNINTGSSAGVVTEPDSNGKFATIDADAEADLVYAIGYRGKKRWSRVVIDFSGTHGTGTPISANAILSRAGISPT